MQFIKKIWNFVFHTEKGLYLVFGVLTTLVSLVVYYLFNGVEIRGVFAFGGLLPNGVELFSLKISGYTFATFLRNVAGIIFAYFTNRGIVFGSTAEGAEKTGELIKFVISRTITLLLDIGMVKLMVDVIGINEDISGLLSTIVVIVLNYILSKLIVFKKK